AEGPRTVLDPPRAGLGVDDQGLRQPGYRFRRREHVVPRRGHMRLGADPTERDLLVDAEVELAAAHGAEWIAGLLQTAETCGCDAIGGLRVAEAERMPELVHEELEVRLSREHHFVPPGHA